MAAGSTDTETETSRALVLDFLEVFSSGDVDKILGMMHEDGTWWVAGTMPGISGTKDREAFGEMLSGISATCTGPIKLTPQAVTAEGNRVAVETESYAELQNGRVYNNNYHFLFEVKDGKILRVKEYLDTEHTTAVFLAP
jgi:ketosteroid isomerase-like protein